MVDLREEPLADLSGYASIPSAFESQSAYDVRILPNGFELLERVLAAPVQKNYDDLENPHSWPSEIGEAKSVVISAFCRDERVGGIIAVVATPGLVSWSTDAGLAILWDLRVAPAHHRRSIATSLLNAATVWARHRGCKELGVETQNTNQAACKFYMHNGFVIAEVRHGAYRELPQDVQIIWRKKLDG